MKRFLAVLTVCVLLVVTLAGCNETSDEQAGKMLQALSTGDTHQAMQLLHPTVVAELSDPQGQLQQIVSLLDGRYVTELQQTQAYTGYKLLGKYTGREEQTVYQLTLDDGSLWQLQTVYYSGTQSGFATFYLSQPEA